MKYRENKYLWVGLIGIAIVAVVILYYATYQGIGISPDSVVYLVSAQSMAQGDGLNTSSGTAISPMEHYAPLYPILLAGISATGLNVNTAARILALILFGANVMLVGWMVFRASGGVIWFAWLGAALTALPIIVLKVHAIALSEPLFFLFGFSGLFLAARFIETGKADDLLFASFLTALAFLDRFIGITLIAAGAAAIFLLFKGKLLKRLYISAAFAIIAALPAFIWIAANSIRSSAVANRQVAYHPIEWDRIRYGLTTSASIYTLLVLVFCTCIFLAATYFRRKIDPNREIVPVTPSEHSILVPVLMLFAGFYVLFIALSISLIDAHTLLDDRMLAPLYMAIMMTVLIAAGRLASQLMGVKSFRYAILAFSLVFIAGLSTATIYWTNKKSYEGQGFNSQVWQQSELLAHINSLSSDIEVYSNAADAIYVLSGKNTAFIPFAYNANSLQPNKNFDEQISLMKANVEQGKAIVVYFDSIYWRTYIPSQEDLEEIYQLRRIQEFEDGSIYQVAD